MFASRGRFATFFPGFLQQSVLYSAHRMREQLHIPYQDHACGQLDEQSTPVLRGSLQVQSPGTGIPVPGACPDPARGLGKTETVNGKGCRKGVRMETRGTSGRSNRRPQRGNNPVQSAAWLLQTNRKYQTTRSALKRRNPCITEVTGCGSPMAILGWVKLTGNHPCAGIGESRVERFGLASRAAAQLPAGRRSMKGTDVRRRSERRYDPDMETGGQRCRKPVRTAPAAGSFPP